MIELASLDIPLLHSQAAWETGPLPDSLAEGQASIAWCQHLVLCFPLWLGDMPALVKAFLEQVLRPGFAKMAKRLQDGYVSLSTTKTVSSIRWTSLG